MKYRIVKLSNGRYKVEHGTPLWLSPEAPVHWRGGYPDWRLNSNPYIFDTLIEAEALVKILREPAVPFLTPEVVKVYED